MLLLALSIQSFSQTVTKVRGRVTDDRTGESIPLAGIYFKGTDIGTTTDFDGSFYLEGRGIEFPVLVCQLLGYDTREKDINLGTSSVVNFIMRESGTRLKGAVVKADDHMVRRLLGNVDANLDRNDPDRLPGYSCEVYCRVELDLTNVQRGTFGNAFDEQLGFVYDYMDTSSFNGKSRLPAMMSETVSVRRHSDDTESDRETIVANRISGINPDNNLLSQFSGGLHLKTNFYRPYINAFGVDFPSPARSTGLLYYNYFIVDSLQCDGRKTYVVHYHPKRGISSPVFDGEMRIDAADYAVKAVRAKMKRGGNVNWLRDLLIDNEYRKAGDSVWFYSRDNLYLDLALDNMSDSTALPSFLGTRKIVWSEPSFGPQADSGGKDGLVTVLSDANGYSPQWWEEHRPYPMEKREEDVFDMVDRIQREKIYKTVYAVTYALLNGYIDSGDVGFGPILKFISFNNLEGFRPQFGMHTSQQWSKKMRLSGYVAYGVKDKQFKGGGRYELILGREPTRKLTLDARYDVTQLGKGKSELVSGNLLSSIWYNGNKLAPESRFTVVYEHEFSSRFNAVADISMKRLYANAFVPLDTWSGTSLGTLATNEMHLGLRFSRDETVNRGYFTKTYLHTNHPVFNVDLTGSVPGLREGDVGFFRPEVSMDWRLHLPPVGVSTLHMDAGMIAGEVPWPLLHLYEGNMTNILDKTAFSCMDYFEFASDKWVTLMLNHNFNGFFLGKIPGISRLNLREQFSFKMAYGGLSDRNNGSAERFGASVSFPDGMKLMDGVPYMEIGAGISNIFKLLRVDCIWRLTHREDAGRLFVVDFGVDLSF